MEMTGSCRAGEQLRSCSVAPFYPRHISQDGPSAYLTPSPSSVTALPSQYPALEERKREDY